MNQGARVRFPPSPHAAVAHQVEHMAENHGVADSSPARGTKNFVAMAERSIATDCKSVKS